MVTATKEKKETKKVVTAAKAVKKNGNGTKPEEVKPIETLKVLKIKAKPEKKADKPKATVKASPKATAKPKVSPKAKVAKRGRGRPQSETLKKILAMEVGDTQEIVHEDVCCKYPEKPQCSLSIMLCLQGKKGNKYECSHTKPHIATVKRLS